MTLNKAAEILIQHATYEISTTHNAITVYISLSEHAERLNKSRFRDCLGSIQGHAFDAFVLSLCKLFERSDNRYPNFSIPTAIQHLQQQMETLNISAEKCAILEEFIQREIDGSFTACSCTDFNRVPRLIIQHFADHCPQSPPRESYDLDTIFDAMRVLRDKRVAHYEDNDLKGLSTTGLEGPSRLLAFAKTAVNVLGYGFFGFSHQSIVSPEKFTPNKSVLWSRMQEIIKILEQ